MMSETVHHRRSESARLTISPRLEAARLYSGMCAVDM